MAVKTGVSMISFVITKEMRRKASSNSYKLPKAEQKKIRAYNKMMKEKKRQKKAAYIAALKKSGQYKNTQAIIINLVLFLKMIGYMNYNVN
jgi:hypothetical protein